MSIGNTTYTETQKQGFPSPPPLHARKRKAPENCFRSYIDQVADGFYHASKLVRNVPQKTSDSYFVIKTRATSVRSYRRNYSHRGMPLYRTKAGGPTRANIEYMSGSFLELDGSTDNTLKTKEDVLTLIRENNLPTASHLIETSRGNFHLIWNYVRPLPWTTKGESYWISQQRRLIQLFQKSGFNVDVGASMNPTQNLRNPSQLSPYNYKRRCEVFIHKSYSKTSLRAIYKALNATNIPNPTPMKASVKLRRYLRANKTFEITLAELAENLGTSLRTVKREIEKATRNGDLQIDQRTGNNKRFLRATRYTSKLYIQSQFSEVPLVSIKDNSVKTEVLLRDFKLVGAKKGRRNKTVFVLAVGLSCESNQTLTVSEIADQLRGGSLRSGLSEKELVRTIKSAVKPAYTNPFSFSKLREWNLIAGTKHFH